MDLLTEHLDLALYSDASRYNIQAVESATGLSARTLRSWERRYSVPSPQRDANGRRIDVVVLELIQPVLYRVGELWKGGQMSMGSEHFGTHLLRSTLDEFFRPHARITLSLAAHRVSCTTSGHSC